MESNHKILLLDDESDLLELYQDILSRLSSRPQVQTATTGARALAMLASQPFRLLICDLKMPAMDGLQVLAIVRRRHPELRTVVMTGTEDEEFRSRAYALGVDLFWLKPETQQNMRMFLECIESLLSREVDHGFRGIQSKSLIDLVQMECLSQSSIVLRVTNGSSMGRIWIHCGELTDAAVDDLVGEEAFLNILSWKSGTFETLPAEPDRSRTIFKPVNGLLLESAQAMDETAGRMEDGSPRQREQDRASRRVSALVQAGAEWAVCLPSGDARPVEVCGTQSGEELAGWMRVACEACRSLSEQLNAGPLGQLRGVHAEREVLLLPWEDKTFLVGWQTGVDAEHALEKSKKIAFSWDS